MKKCEDGKGLGVKITSTFANLWPQAWVHGNLYQKVNESEVITA